MEKVGPIQGKVNEAQRLGKGVAEDGRKLGAL